MDVNGEIQKKLKEKLMPNNGVMFMHWVILKKKYQQTH